METIKVKEHEFTFGPVETQAPAGFLATAYVDRDDISPFLGEIHEVHGLHFKDIISSINENHIGTRVAIVFNASTIPFNDALVITASLLRQAVNLHEDRARKRSKRAHPSSGSSNGLVVVNTDRYHAQPAQTEGDNVPPRYKNNPGLRKGY